MSKGSTSSVVTKLSPSYYNFPPFHLTERVVRIGNDLKPSASGVDVPGATFILNNAFLSDGVVFAFSAFFRSDKAMRFQVWRPTPSKKDFQLIGEIEHIPSVMYSHEDVSSDLFYYFTVVALP